jgi:very-short-patch-repair endonuclease
MRLRCFARQMRSAEATDAERHLWYHLRGRRTANLKFRRQQPIGDYIVDFVCLEKRIAVELDGGQHNESAADRARDRWLEDQGYRVLRYWNDDALLRVQSVLEDIVNVASLHAPSPPPLSRAAGEG